MRQALNGQEGVRMELSEQGKGAEETVKLVNEFIGGLCKILGNDKQKDKLTKAVIHAVNEVFDPAPQDLERKKRLERHVHVLQTCYHTISQGDDWERLQEVSAALVAGGMAIQRMLKEDYPKEQEGEKDAR